MELATITPLMASARFLATRVAHYNTASGALRFYDNQYGSNNNTASGYQTLYSNITFGYNNTANGYQALYSNTNGYDNTASGYQALYANATGSLNTADGYQALYANTGGTRNTAMGYSALGNNSNGGDNTAIGYNALGVNSTGGGNVAIGEHALADNNGTSSTAVGFDACPDQFERQLQHRHWVMEPVTQSAPGNNNNIEIFDPGSAGDDSTIRIGTQGTQTTTYIAGDLRERRFRPPALCQYM